MKLDKEMEMLLNKILLLHHDDRLGRREANDDLSCIIQELVALGVVSEDEEGVTRGLSWGGRLEDRREQEDLGEEVYALDAVGRPSGIIILFF